MSLVVSAQYFIFLLGYVLAHAQFEPFFANFSTASLSLSIPVQQSKSITSQFLCGGGRHCDIVVVVQTLKSREMKVIVIHVMLFPKWRGDDQQSDHVSILLPSLLLLCHLPFASLLWRTADFFHIFFLPFFT